jgi:hypothetical protein
MQRAVRGALLRGSFAVISTYTVQLYRAVELSKATSAVGCGCGCGWRVGVGVGGGGGLGLGVSSASASASASAPAPAPALGCPAAALPARAAYQLPALPGANTRSPDHAGARGEARRGGACARSGALGPQLSARRAAPRQVASQHTARRSLSTIFKTQRDSPEKRHSKSKLSWGLIC